MATAVLLLFQLFSAGRFSCHTFVCFCLCCKLLLLLLLLLLLYCVIRICYRSQGCTASKWCTGRLQKFEINYFASSSSSCNCSFILLFYDYIIIIIIIIVTVLSTLCKVFTIICLKQTMFLGYIVLQLSVYTIYGTGKVTSHVECFVLLH
jgi:hypothetical protein